MHFEYSLTMGLSFWPQTEPCTKLQVYRMRHLGKIRKTKIIFFMLNVLFLVN